MTLSQLWDRTVCLLYPPRCVLCGTVVEYDDLWCGRCPLETEPLIHPGRGALPGLASPLPYAGGVRKSVLTLKKQQDKRAVRFFAEHMAEVMRAQWDIPFQLAAPVPASSRQLKARGYNQAWLLAEAVAGILGCDAAPDILRRGDDVEAQHSLSAAGRKENARRAYGQGDDIGAVRGKRILLVDDVFTTGATLAACTTLLREAGAAEVCGVTAAYTVLKGHGGSTPAPSPGGNMN